MKRYLLTFVALLTLLFWAEVQSQPYYQAVPAGSITGTVSPVHGGTGVANNVSATLTRSGNHAVTLTTTGTTSITLPTSGTLPTSANFAYGMVYLTNPYTVAATNTWYDLPMDADGTKAGISHSTVTNNPQITITNAGIYSVCYRATWRRPGAAHHGVMRLYLNNTSEIAGSFEEDGLTSGDANEVRSMGRCIVASLAASDYFTVQVGSNVTGQVIDNYDDGSIPDPTTRVYANVTVLRLNP